MSLLDTFYFLFKTNAKEAAKEVDEFGKRTQDVQDKLNRTDQTASKLGLSFQKLALAGVTALGEFAALGKLKDGITNAINYNAEIEKTAKLTGINARQLSIWNDVVARAGGNPGGKEYLSFITKLNQQYAGLGINDRIKRVNQDLIGFSAKFAELERNSPGSSQALANKLGIGPDLWLALKEGPEVLQRNIDKMKELDNTTEKTGNDAFEMKQQWVEVGVAFNSAFNSATPILNGVATLLEKVANRLRAVFDVFSGNSDDLKHFSFGRKLTAIGDLLRGNIAGSVADLIPPADNNAPSIGPQGIRNNNPGNLRSAPGAGSANGFARFDTLQQGIAAEQRQLGIYGRRGWNTLAQIAAHWAPPGENNTRAYLAALVHSTGFDANQPLDLSNPSITARVSNAINRQENGPQYGALINGQGLLAQADSLKLPSGSSSNSKTVTIGKIVINTQATDARGIAGDLHSELQSTVGAFDDGVKY